MSAPVVSESTDNIEPLIFWHDGFDGGRGGAFVRAVALNEIIPKWIADGIQVAGIRIDPAHGNNVELVIAFDSERPRDPHTTGDG